MILGSSQLGSLGAQLGAAAGAAIVPVVRALEIVGSYLPVIDLVGSYVDVLELTGSIEMPH